MHSTITRSFLILAVLALPTSPALAATTDGLFGGVGEYSFNTEAAPNDKHDTHGHGTSSGHGNGGGGTNSEYNDGSGGDRYDLNYLGFDISGGQFQFGAVGGDIAAVPVPAAFWLFGSALIGFIGISRRTRV